jgi:hypothetical protein
MNAALRVAIIDDLEDSRNQTKDELASFGVCPVVLSGPFDSAASMVRAIKDVRAEAAIFDYKLNTNDFSRDSGAAGASSTYCEHISAMLVTKYSKADLPDIRPYRRWIPDVVFPDDLDYDCLMNSIAICRSEFEGTFRVTRRPWRAQVRVEGFDRRPSGHLFLDLIVPGWNSERVIRTAVHPIDMDRLTDVKEGNRYHARVNLGAEHQDDLYISGFEPQ